MRPVVLHALRDPRRARVGLRRLPRAGVLLSARQTPGRATADARRAAASDRSHQPPAARRAEQADARRAAASDRSHQPPAQGAGGWWASYFDASYLTEFAPIFDLVQDRREVARLLELLALPAGARILDVPCGQGRHAHLLAEAGFDVDGLDYSAPLLAAARRRGTGRTLRYTRGDMRKLPARWTGRFDAVVNLFTSFGFFGDPADDAQVIHEFARVLAPGGTFVFHGGCRDGVMARFLDRDWWQLEDGTMVGQERSFDPLSGILTVETTSAGPAAFPPRQHRIRLYTPTRLAELCRDAGLIVEEAYDGWADRALRRTSTEMLLVARKEQVPSRRRRR